VVGWCVEVFSLPGCVGLLMTERLCGLVSGRGGSSRRSSFIWAGGGSSLTAAFLVLCLSVFGLSSPCLSVSPSLGAGLDPLLPRVGGQYGVQLGWVVRLFGVAARWVGPPWALTVAVFLVAVVRLLGLLLLLVCMCMRWSVLVFPEGRSRGLNGRFTKRGAWYGMTTSMEGRA